jgi:acetoin utilization protein AcuC
MGELVGARVPPETPVPESWRAFVAERLKVPSPALMTDGFEPKTRTWQSGYDPADPIDAAVLRTREAVFPWHGLAADPYHGF